MQRLCIASMIATVVLGCALAAAIAYAGRIGQDRQRLRQNQQVLLGEVREYRVRDSLHAVTVGVLSLRASEIERNCQTLSAMVRDMGLKMKRLESLSEHALESRYAIRAAVEETVVRDSTAAVAAHRIRYNDPHLDFDGLIRDGMFEGSVVCRDTLTQAVHRVPRKFLFIRWGTKSLRQEIVSSNPHTRIVYSRFIRVVK